jgi:hypothetical protein
VKNKIKIQEWYIHSQGGQNGKGKDNGRTFEG